MKTALPSGVEVLDLDDLIEADQLRGADSVDAGEALAEHIKGLDRTATDGGVLLTKGDFRVLSQLATAAVEAARTAHNAAMTVALARLEGVR